MRIIELNDTTRGELLESLLKRSPNNYGEYEDTVNGIIEDVRQRGDEAAETGRVENTTSEFAPFCVLRQ